MSHGQSDGTGAVVVFALSASGRGGGGHTVTENRQPTVSGGGEGGSWFKESLRSVSASGWMTHDQCLSLSHTQTDAQ